MCDDESVFQSDSVEATRLFGQRLGQWAEPGTTVALIGPLGAGKTHLAKGVAVGLDVADERKVISPTFVIVREHAARLRLYHVDAYRVSAGELADIGFEEMCSAGGVVLVEWADRATEILPDDHLTITIDPTGANTRRLSCRAVGVIAHRLLAKLFEA